VRGVTPTWAGPPPRTAELCGLGLGLLRNRECDPVVLDARIENLVVEERGSLGFEEDPGSLLSGEDEMMSFTA
jgi:hypothetical protein